MSSTPPFDKAVAHRWFGIEFNNRAWDLVESKSQAPDDLAEMLATAHASLLHWKAVGTPLNEIRGLVLLVSAYVAAGVAQPAETFSRKLLELSGRIEGETPIDRASAQRYGGPCPAFRREPWRGSRTVSSRN